MYYNEDENGNRKKIEAEKYVKTLDELILQFGGYTANGDIFDGQWINPETSERIDDQTRAIWILCENTKKNVDFLTRLKRTLMERFQQDDILMFNTRVNKF